MADENTCEIEEVPAWKSDTKRDELYVVFNGKRGYPGTPQTGKWVSIEPSFQVTMKGTEVIVAQDGKRLD